MESQDSWQVFHATSADLAVFWGLLPRLSCAGGGMGRIFVPLGELNSIAGRLFHACYHLAAESSSGGRRHREAAQVNGIVRHHPEK